MAVGSPNGIVARRVATKGEAVKRNGLLSGAMLSAMYTSGQNQMFQRALLKHNRIGPVTFIGDENARLRSRPSSLKGAHHPATPPFQTIRITKKSASSSLFALCRSKPTPNQMARSATSCLKRHARRRPLWKWTDGQTLANCSPQNESSFWL